MAVTAAAVVGALSIALGTLSELNSMIGTEISGKNADTIATLYDQAIDYYNKLQNGYNVKISSINNLINDLRSAQMGMTGTPRALVSAAIERANRKLNKATEKSIEASNVVNRVNNEKVAKLQNESAHSLTALFRKQRNAGNVAGDLMSDEALQGLIAHEKGTDVTATVNNSLINAGAMSSSETNNARNNQNGGKPNV